MAKKDTYQPLREVEFQCRPCGRMWRCAPEQLSDWPEDEIHPWRYLARCQSCGELCEQSSRERGLLRAWRKGDRTTRGGGAGGDGEESGHGSDAWIQNVTPIT